MIYLNPFPQTFPWNVAKPLNLVIQTDYHRGSIFRVLLLRCQLQLIGLQIYLTHVKCIVASRETCAPLSSLQCQAALAIFSLNLFCNSVVANPLLTHETACCLLVCLRAFQLELAVVCAYALGAERVMENSCWGSQRTYIISLILTVGKYVKQPELSPRNSNIAI